LKNDVLYNIVS